MQENDLQINITAVDDASSVLEGVSTTAEGMAEVVDTASKSINDALSSIDEEVQNTRLTWEESLQELSDSILGADSAAANMGGQFSATSEEMTVAMERMAELTGTTSGEIEANFEGIAKAQQYLIENAATDSGAFSDDMGQMAVAAATAAGEIESSLSGAQASEKGLASGAGILGLGIALTTVGKPIQDFYTGAVTAFEGTQSAIATLTPAVQDLINQGNDLKNGDGEITAIKTVLIDKINAQKAALAALEVPINGHNKTTAELAVAQSQAAASIQTHSDTLAQLEGQLDRFNNTATMAGANLNDMTSALEDQAKKNTDVGFTYQESLASLKQLTQETGSVQTGIEANNDAMELARSRIESLSDATNQVAQAYNGQGRSLAQIGILIKDGVAGQASLQSISEQTTGSVGASMSTLAVQVSVLDSKWNLFMNDLGNSQNGVLGPFIKMLTGVVEAVDAWTQKHPLLTQAILLFLGVMGTLMVFVGGAIVIFGLLALGIGAAGAAFVVAGIIIGAAVITAIALVTTHFTALKDWLIKIGTEIVGAIKYTWDAVVDYLSDKELAIYNNMVTGFNKILAWMKQIWGEISDTVTGVITSIENAIDGLITKIGDALKAVAKLPGNIAGGIMGGASSIIGGAINMFADGGIVTGPTLGIVGEAGPEAIIPLSAFNGGNSLAGNVGGGNGGGISVVLNGNFYGTDQGTATKFANMIATMINRQIKLKNF